MALNQPIRIGDAVLVVPLGYLIERPIRDWTKSSAQLLETIHVYLDYAVPVEAIRSKAREILGSTPLWDGRAWAVQAYRACGWR